MSMSLEYEPFSTQLQFASSQSPLAFLSQESTVTRVNRGSTLALRRATLDVCLGGQQSLRELTSHSIHS